MKTIAILLALVGLTSCGVPVAVSVDYTDPDTGLAVGAGYSSKGGLKVEASK